jgi:hypothetical protein
MIWSLPWDEIFHYLRWYNLVTSFFCFLWLTMKLNKNWDIYPDAQTHAHGIVMWMMVFAYVWGTSENIYQETTTGPRVLVVSLSATTLLWLLYSTRGRTFAYSTKRNGDHVA